MSYKEGHESIKATRVLHKDMKRINNDVIDRFLCILWKKEVDCKLTYK